MFIAVVSRPYRQLIAGHLRFDHGPFNYYHLAFDRVFGLSDLLGTELILFDRNRVVGEGIRIVWMGVSETGESAAGVSY